MLGVFYHYLSLSKKVISHKDISGSRTTEARNKSNIKLKTGHK
jgi:hypothetical protein